MYICIERDYIYVRVKKDLKTLKEGRCIPSRSKARNICFKQVKPTAAFKSKQISKTWKIQIYNTNCKTEYIIYLMECTRCNLEYVGKYETPFNIRLNKRRKDVKDLKAILADKQVQ